MKLCAVVGCSNGSYQLDKWKNIDCTKHGTKNGCGCCDCLPPFRLFPFPTERKDASGRMRWNKLLNKKDPKTGRNWENKAHDRVCSVHFPKGEPVPSHPDPVLKLGYENHRKFMTSKRAPPQQRHTTPKKPKLVPEDDSVGATPMSKIQHDHRYTYQCECKPNCDCIGCFDKQVVIKELENKIVGLECQLNACKNKIAKKSNEKQLFRAKNLKNDSDVNHCTGLRSKQAFNDLFNYIEPYTRKMVYWKSNVATKTASRNFKGSPKKSGPKRNIGPKDEMLMVLMRLRLDLTIQFLAVLFGVLPSTCSQVITTWLRFLSITLKPLIVWPNRHTISSLMPQQFKNHCKKLRCIIDCTEIFIERPRSLELQAATWSDYKKHNTIKVLVGITPNGQVSFLSKAYGGRASDVFIVRDSGFLTLIEPHDVLMADRGFPIQEDLMLQHASLQIPPAAQGNRQMTRDKVKKTKKIANLRIHVERAINRLKDFKILDSTLPITLIPVSDDIITVCASLCNLQPDLIR